MDIKDFILIGGGILIALVIGHGFWIAWRAKREPLRLDIVPDLIPDDMDDIERLRGELPNGGARVRNPSRHPRQQPLQLDAAAPTLMEPTNQEPTVSVRRSRDKPRVHQAPARLPQRAFTQDDELAGIASEPSGATAVGPGAVSDVEIDGIKSIATRAPMSRFTPASSVSSAHRSSHGQIRQRLQERLAGGRKPDLSADKAAACDAQSRTVDPESERLHRAQHARSLRQREQEQRTLQQREQQQRRRANRERQQATAEAAVEELLVLHVLAPEGQRFSGEALVTALRDQGLRYGEMNIFHRVDNATKAKIFSVANMVEPGTFDLSDLEEMRSPGMSFFLRLPGPEEATVAFSDMLHAARNVALALGGELRDEQFSMLTGQTTEHMRQRIADFARRRLSMRA